MSYKSLFGNVSTQQKQYLLNLLLISDMPDAPIPVFRTFGEQLMGLSPEENIVMQDFWCKKYYVSKFSVLRIIIKAEAARLIKSNGQIFPRERLPRESELNSLLSVYKANRSSRLSWNSPCPTAYWNKWGAVNSTARSLLNDLGQAIAEAEVKRRYNGVRTESFSNIPRRQDWWDLLNIVVEISKGATNIVIPTHILESKTGATAHELEPILHDLTDMDLVWGSWDKVDLLCSVKIQGINAVADGRIPDKLIAGNVTNNFQNSQFTNSPVQVGNIDGSQFVGNDES